MQYTGGIHYLDYIVVVHVDSLVIHPKSLHQDPKSVFNNSPSPAEPVVEDRFIIGQSVLLFSMRVWSH